LILHGFFFPQVRLNYTALPDCPRRGDDTGASSGKAADIAAHPSSSDARAAGQAAIMNDVVDRTYWFRTYTIRINMSSPIGAKNVHRAQRACMAGRISSIMLYGAQVVPNPG
jgi:hypothetical protein